MGLLDGFEKIMRRERFERLVAAFDAACRWELYDSATLFGDKLYSLGAWIDDEGNWREDTRPIKPIAPALPADEEK